MARGIELRAWDFVGELLTDSACLGRPYDHEASAAFTGARSPAGAIPASGDSGDSFHATLIDNLRTSVVIRHHGG